MIRLVTAMARRMGLDEAGEPALAELARDVAPEEVMDRIERAEDGEGAPPPSS